MVSSCDDRWFIWSVRPEKLSIIQKYLENSIPGVANVVCPIVTSERLTKTGKTVKKTSLLYGCYIFVQYTHDTDNPVTWSKINDHPFIVGYIGPCTQKDVTSLPK